MDETAELEETEFEKDLAVSLDSARASLEKRGVAVNLNEVDSYKIKEWLKRLQKAFDGLNDRPSEDEIREALSSTDMRMKASELNLSEGDPVLFVRSPNKMVTKRAEGKSDLFIIDLAVVDEVRKVDSEYVKAHYSIDDPSSVANEIKIQKNGIIALRLSPTGEISISAPADETAESLTFVDQRIGIIPLRNLTAPQE